MSMDGRGRAKDNIFIERLSFEKFKQENIYLNAYEDGQELYAGFAGFITYFDFYNHKLQHQSLNYKRLFELCEKKIVI